MTRGKGIIKYRRYKEKIEYIYQILKLISIKPLTHTQLKSYTENSNSEAFNRHIAPMIEYHYLKKNDSEYQITAKGREFLDKLDSISVNLIELNHNGFSDTFISDFLEYQSSKLKETQRNF